MEYLILRLIFINPMTLPSMTESFLRKDFHFAMYLGYCFGKTLTRFFQWSIMSLLLLFSIIITVDILVDEIDGASLQSYFGLAGIVFNLVTLILLRSCLSSVEKQVMPSVFEEDGNVRNPENFDICMNEHPGPVDQFI